MAWSGFPTMARPLRIEYAGAVYHVMARGNQGREIFPGDQDRECFWEAVGEAGEKTGWWVDGCASHAGGGPDATKTGKEIGALETATIANEGTNCLKRINVTFLGLTLSRTALRNKFGF